MSAMVCRYYMSQQYLIMNISVFATIEINDALLKLNLYLNLLTSPISTQRLEKIVVLVTETFIKFMQNEQFAKECYDKVKELTMKKHSYYGLLIIDQMLKNNKLVFKAAKRDIEQLFKVVWQKTMHEYDNTNTNKQQNLKLMVKVWGYIYGQKYEQNLKKWLEQVYKIKLTVSPEHEALLIQLYGVTEQPKHDYKIDEFMNNMELQQKPKKNGSPNESLLQALGFDQD